VVDAILDHPAIGAVSFVGSSDIAHYVYSRGVAAGQARAGDGRGQEPRRRHARRRPRPDRRRLVRRGVRLGGERCMALPVVVPVGEQTAEALRERLIPAIARLRVGVSTDPRRTTARWSTPRTRPGSSNGSRPASTKAPSWWSTAAASRSRGTRSGFFLGPSLFDRVTPR
jgi:malonate-semialdehyde dehydrogenase (acetylating)/methylmalonate-semialdehyde dehydrogenase